MRGASGQRCESCRVPLPRGAARCPGCGTKHGGPFLVGEVDERAANHVAMPARPRRQLALVAVTVVGLLGVLVLVDRPDPNAPAAEPALAPTTAAPTTATTSTTPETLPDRGSGGPAATRLLVSGSDGTTMLDLDSGVVSRPHGFANANIVPVQDGVFLGGPGALAFYAPPFDGEPRVLALFRNSTVVPSASTDRAWVVNSDPTMTAQEIARNGTVTVPPFELPPMSYAIGAVDRGVLIGLHDSLFVTQGAGDLRPLGPGRPIAASARTVATIVCDQAANCSFALVDVASGRRHTARVDDWSGADVAGAFSPDGSRLAVLTSDREGPWLAIVDVTTGATTQLVRDSNAAVAASVAWSPSGDWVFWLAGSTVRATNALYGESREIWSTPAHLFALYALDSS